MARGGPRKADGPSKKGSRVSTTVLSTPEIIEVPPMPPAEDWIGLPLVGERKGADKRTAELAGYDDDGAFDEEEMVPEWSPAVVKWWNDIWTSPMASQFDSSDIHGLYLGCYYLHESLNPFYKLTERTAAAKQFENTLKNYGLNPSAREGLRWQIAQGTAAQKRTDQIRSSMSSTYGDKKSSSEQQDMYRRHV